MQETDVTLIVALITAIAAILAPLATAIINRVSEYRLRTLELFFNEKAQAYKQYLDITSRFPPNPSSNDLQELNSAMNQATLYSSEDTSKMMALYVHYLMDTKNPDYDAIAKSHLAVCEAMQAELKNYKKHY